ncbi:MAG: HEAT repeat domain-containing protein [Aquabacterium sp.]|uniref:HEAT repeat domain-containing protein n=1 Tax=Aquabacterium sp. TaxID=1872578 RepID=UPI0025C627DC|nr:HEAT repeat domain-containing protein [Aquabacterium sp.]MBI5926697.1 HEAT repeat domain-containing protein [Aquabacterium sp.]
MSGGISAIRGFDYQATVILDLLFQHFESHGPGAIVRPEGKDDLDLRWTEAGAERHRFIQVKKPREDALARPKPSSWSLADVVRDLLPKVLTRLADNDDQQYFVLGDSIATAVRRLFDAGVEAPFKASSGYWVVIHSLARAQAQQLLRDGSVAARSASKRRIPSQLSDDPKEALAALVTSANTFARRHGAAGAAFFQRYSQEAERLHRLLPSVLQRTQFIDANGREEEVAERVMRHLEQRYRLQRSIVKDTLFRNLRGFINDIAKEPGLTFNREDLETELRCVWPQMVPIKAPPPLETDHIGRPSLAASFIDPWAGVAMEVVGISGAGKTRLAAEILERARLIHSQRAALYAEVRSGTSLRDCLVGAAFHLRRRGLSEPFAVAIQPDQANESALSALAKAFSSMPSETLLLLDLVEGSEPPSFGRDLATFVRALSCNTLRLIVFGQERVFREVTPQEQAQIGVSSIDAPGLNFEEFVKLVQMRHKEADRVELWDLYHQLTAGRAAGLNVSLARAIAQVDTPEERESIAARPADDRLAFAERSRFGRVSDGARAAAEKLTCFALPFRRADAESVFRRDNVGSAIRELLDLGLLRLHDGETLEMHETVRAGLEELIAPQTRLDAHATLADWYQKQGQVGAVVFHLEKSGQSAQAQARAREAFLAGDCWAALWPFLIRHQLVSAAEVVTVVANGERIEEDYLLPSMLKELGDQSVTEALLDLLRVQSERLSSDPQWAKPIIEAILAIEPSRLDALIELLIRTVPNPNAMSGVLSELPFAARRQRVVIGPSTMALFDRQPEAVQKLLLSLLLQGGLASLQHALQYLWKHPLLAESGRDGGWPAFTMQIRSPEDVSDLLRALPAVEPSEMIRVRGPCLGPLGGMIWHARKALRAPCVAVLQAQALDGPGLANAIRILLYLGEPRTLELCEGLNERLDAAGALARMVPAVVPTLIDWRPYERRVEDQSVGFVDRAQALITLASSGAQLNKLVDRLQTNDSANWPHWVPILQVIASMAPFAAAIPILKEALVSGDDHVAVQLPGIIARQGQTPGRDATDALLQALAHPKEWVRFSAAYALARRRDHAALPRLIEHYGREVLPEIQAVLATAILASGAKSAEDLAARSHTPAADLWWCVLAHRTRDVRAADRLVAIATNQTQLWSVRRAAIAAAGRLPYEVALARIEPVVMAEYSPFTIDRHRSLFAHEALTAVFPEADGGLRQLFQGNRAGFVSCFEPYFEASWQRTFDRSDLPPGADIAGWLYDALVEGAVRACPGEQLNNALHIPLLQAAVLRALRIQGKVDRIDAHLASASHVWLAIRALMERSRFPERGLELGQSLQTAIAKAAWVNDRVVKEFLDQLATPRTAKVSSDAGANAAQTDQGAVIVSLSFWSARDLLVGRFNGPVREGPMVLRSIEEDECETLICLADPKNDPEQGETVFIPAVSFSKLGHRVSQVRTTYRGGPSMQERLRKAIAAANRFKLSMPWHTAQLEGRIGDSYAADFLACLAAQGDTVRFYEALAEAEEVMMPALCKNAYALSAQLEIDHRLVPALTRFLAVGGDDVFQGLCILAKRIDVPEIQPILEGLLHRWIRRFEVKADHAQNDAAFALWHGFHRLIEHPRFDAIPNWPQLLESLLVAPMNPHRFQSIMRVLERDAASYALIEMRLFKEANWAHCGEDEVERLDRAAEVLFAQTQNTGIKLAVEDADSK